MSFDNVQGAPWGTHMWAITHRMRRWLMEGKAAEKSNAKMAGRCEGEFLETLQHARHAVDVKRHLSNTLLRRYYSSKHVNKRLQ